MKQTSFSWFSAPSTIAIPPFNSSGEYCLQLFAADDVGDDDDDDDDDGILILAQFSISELEGFNFTVISENIWIFSILQNMSKSCLNKHKSL